MNVQLSAFDLDRLDQSRHRSEGASTLASYATCSIEVALTSSSSPLAAVVVWKTLEVTTYGSQLELCEARGRGAARVGL